MTTPMVGRRGAVPTLPAPRTIERCHGCGGWITPHRMDTQGCTTCRMLAARPVTVYTPDSTEVDPCPTPWCVLEDDHYGNHQDRDGNP